MVYPFGAHVTTISTEDMIMEDNLIIQNSQNEKHNGFGSNLIWLLKGFLFPCWSREFYKKASERRVIVAVAFLFIFAIAQTSVTAIQVAIAMNDAGYEIKQAYKKGVIPSIVIKDGLANVDGSQPYIFEDKRQFIAIDTTGGIREINTSEYSEGMLLTRSELHFVNEDGYRVFQLADLNETFGNPIVLDKAHVLEIWNKASLAIDLVAFIGVFIWNSIVRLAYVVLIGLVVWGIVSIKRQGIGFSPILITGIYAIVPTTYLMFVLKQIGIGFFSLYTILFIVIWIIALSFVLESKTSNSVKPDET
jgi:hypothetical protein